MPVIPIIAIGVGIASLATGISAKNKQEEAGEEAANQALKMGKENADILRGQADQNKKVMGYQMGQFDRNTGRFRDTQLAATAASGVDMGGSSMMLSHDIRNQVSTDRKNMHEQFSNQQKDLMNRARLSEEHGASQSTILQNQADANAASATAGILGGVGNTISSFQSSADYWWG